MSGSEHPDFSDDRERRELRARLFALFEETGERCYLDAARTLRKSGDGLIRGDILFTDDTAKKNPPHRPPLDDAAALWEMARLVISAIPMPKPIAMTRRTTAVRLLLADVCVAVA